MNNEQDNNTETVFVSKYDVLLTVNSEGELEFFLPFSSDDSLNDSHRAADRAPPPPPPQQLQRQQSQPHVGNNRFSILCKMYLTEFRMADTEQQQTAVLQKLHDMISQQCIDSACARAGKFLLRQDEHAQSSRSGGWVELTREQAYSFIRSSLELEQVKSAAGLVNEPPSSSQTTLQDDKKRRRHSSLLRRSMSGGDVTAGSDQKKRIAQRQSIRPSIRQSTIHLAQFLEGVDFDFDDENDNGNNDAEQTMMIDASQNSSSSPVMMLQRSGSWCANNDDKQHVVQTANALDVILRIDPSTLSYSLVPNHTGNNRIGVMIQMQTSKYVALRESQGTAISVCRDLVDMVKDNYCGKFLVQVNNGQDDDYRCLTDEQAISALDSVFSIAAGIAQKPAPPAVAAVYNNNKQDETLSQVDPIPISFAWNVVRVAVVTPTRRHGKSCRDARSGRGSTPRLASWWPRRVSSGVIRWDPLGRFRFRFLLLPG